jgi:hypothetical protein
MTWFEREVDDESTRRSGSERLPRWSDAMRLNRAKVGRLIAAGVSLGAMAWLSGCVTYYRVTDRESGKVYYTNNVLSDFRPVSNSVHLVDPRDWQGRLLMSPKVEKIPAKEYNLAVGKPDIKNDMNW